MTFDNTFPQRLTKIDDLTRSDHFYLTEEDICYFIGEYTAYKGYTYSDTNQLIFNLKKSMDRHGKSDWKYKGKAIQAAADAFRIVLNSDKLDCWIFVPIPPSKAKGDPLYDDRMTQMLRAIRPAYPLDVREIICQIKSTKSFHESNELRSYQQIEKLYRINKKLMKPKPRFIAVVDDVLTTGAHFHAAKSILSTEFPEVPIVGLFIARCRFRPGADGSWWAGRGC